MVPLLVAAFVALALAADDKGLHRIELHHRWPDAEHRHGDSQRWARHIDADTPAMLEMGQTYDLVTDSTSHPASAIPINDLTTVYAAVKLENFMNVRSRDAA